MIVCFHLALLLWNPPPDRLDPLTPQEQRDSVPEARARLAAVSAESARDATLQPGFLYHGEEPVASTDRDEHSRQRSAADVQGQPGNLPPPALKFLL